MKNTKLFENEHIEYLNREVGVVVSPLHTFGTDALLLANFASPRKKDVACDLGTGCGIIPLIWCRDEICTKISAVEIQEKGYNQLCRSIEMNEIEKLKAYHSDLKSLKGVLNFSEYDLVTMNPPYKKENAGIKSADECEKIARHETLCTIDDICSASAKLLKFHGRFCVCIRPERLFETMDAMKNNKIEPKRLRLVVSRKDLAPWLCLIEGKRGAKSGMAIEKNLILYNDDGNYSDEMLQILGAYKEGIDNGR